MPSTCSKWLAGIAGLALLAAQPAGAQDKPAPVGVATLSGAYLAARIAESDNDLDGAIAYYRRALSFDADNKDLQKNLMLALISQGDFDAALPEAEKLKTEPEVERFSRLALAVDSIRKKEYTQAETWLKLALESDLDRLISSLMTAWMKLGNAQAEDALTYLGKLKGPEWYVLFTTYHRALIADAAGLEDKAISAYAEVLDNVSAGGAAPDTWIRSAESYARLLARRGEKENALAVLDKADEFAHARLPIVALRDAIMSDKPVVRLVDNPVSGATEVLLNLGTALNRGGGEAFVKLYLQYALALEPANDQVLLQLATVAELQREPEQAIRLYKSIPDNSPVKQVSELQLGLNLADLGRHDEAIEHLKALLDSMPDDMRAYLALGGVYASKEDFKSASEVYDRAVARLGEPKRENWNIFYQRGIAYERLKEWPKAEPNFRKALELFPDQPQVMNYLGYSWVDMDMNLEEGLELIRKAVDRRPSDGYIVDSLGWAYYKLGRFDDAVRELERAVSLKPDDPVLNDHLGDAYWRAGRRLEATFQWSHARDMKPEPDVLASVEKKLNEGLPALPGKKAAQKKSGKRGADAKQVAPHSANGQRKEVASEQLSPGAQVVPAAYTVQRGQSLWSIAVEKLGDGNRYLEILKLNPELRGDPGQIVPGQSLRMPSAN